MDPLTILATMPKWIELGTKLFRLGKDARDRIFGAMRAEGLEADTAALDAVIVDAEARAAVRRVEAGGAA